MPIDPSIALQYQGVKMPDPMNAYAQVMQIQNAQNQNALAQYQLSSAKRNDEVQAGFLNDVRNAGNDPDALRNAFFRAGKVKDYNDMIREQAVADKTRADTLTANINNFRQQAASIPAGDAGQSWWDSMRPNAEKVAGHSLPPVWDAAGKQFVVSTADQALERLSPKLEFSKEGASITPRNPYSGAMAAPAIPVGMTADEQSKAIFEGRAVPAGPPSSPTPIPGQPTANPQIAAAMAILDKAGYKFAGNDGGAPVNLPTMPAAQQVAPTSAASVQTPDQSVAPVPGALPGLQLSPKAQMDVNAKNAEARNKVATDFASDRNKNIADYEKNLQGKVSAGLDLDNRMASMQSLLTGPDNFTPGALSEWRMNMARTLKTAGASDATTNMIANGNVGSMQAFEKLAVQGAMESLREAIATGRITNAEFKAFSNANPNIETDPQAITKIFAFNRDISANHRNELASFNGYLRTGGIPAEWPSVWADQRAKQNADKLASITANPTAATTQQPVGTSPATPAPATPAPEPKRVLLDSMPMAGPNKGKRLMSPDGVWARSDGNSWVKENAQ